MPIWRWNDPHRRGDTDLECPPPNTLGFGSIGENGLGSVIDMFDASKTGFIWVFNPADVFIDVGIALLILCVVFGRGADTEVGHPRVTSA
ncbi:signal peptidase II [Novosphingobium organovorum]